MANGIFFGVSGLAGIQDASSRRSALSGGKPCSSSKAARIVDSFPMQSKFARLKRTFKKLLTKDHGVQTILGQPEVDSRLDSRGPEMAGLKLDAGVFIADPHIIEPQMHFPRVQVR